MPSHLACRRQKELIQKLLLEGKASGRQAWWLASSFKCEPWWRWLSEGQGLAVRPPPSTWGRASVPGGWPAGAGAVLSVVSEGLAERPGVPPCAAVEQEEAWSGELRSLGLGKPREAGSC